MIKSKQKKKVSLIGGIAATLIGVGAAVAGAVVLRDKKNRNKVKKVLTKAGSRAVNYVKKIKKSPKKVTKNKLK